MEICKLCKKEKLISKNLGICLDCIRKKPKEVIIYTKEVHQKVREIFNLPFFPPKTTGGIKCDFCFNQCIIGKGEKGYCGLRENLNGVLKSITDSEKGVLDFYYDPIPTNCCAEWFCGADKEGRGKYNLAVFFYGCSFDCLFCQNYSHKFIEKGNIVSFEQLVKKSEKKEVYCVCFFGGSPEPQMPFVISFSEAILKKREIKICFEWNGSGNEIFVKKVGEIALKSKGIIKFDLKAFDENLNIVLTGVSNKKTYENFELIAKEILPKADYPLLTATTLLVPGYIDEIEVEKIAKFISSLNSEIPYSLLIFHPEFYMNDLPITPKETVYKCYNIAKKYLKNVHIGNLHLLNLG
ncbi:MAG: radical SAM protein [bacterium]|nr:radical SAM protein [bacterium]MCX7916760.1 radical SAM protein [bacterium]MDW8164407.1 radical SAM protein [Candidatus Omnitrophota bacterium]